MAVKASDTITIFRVVDIISTTVYYLLQSSTAQTPSVPTTDPPGGNWTTIEPTYIEGSTNTLYTVIKTKYSGNLPGKTVDFEYTPVSISTSYEAAKDAYNKALIAKQKIDNLKVGSENLINILINTPTGQTNWESGAYSTSNGEKITDSKKIRTINLLSVDANQEYAIKIYNYDNTIESGMTTPREYEFNFVCFQKGAQTEQGYKLIFKSEYTQINKDCIIWTCPNNVDCIGIFINLKNDTTHAVSLSDLENAHFLIKMEKGNTYTGFSYSLQDQEDMNELLYKQIEKRISDANAYADGKAADGIAAKAVTDSYLEYKTTVLEPAISRIGKVESGMEKFEGDLRAFAQLIGGNNLIRNSVGYAETKYWEVIGNGTITTYQDSMLEDSTTSQSAIRIVSTSNSVTKLKQSGISVQPVQHSLSFKIIHKTGNNDVNIYIEDGENIYNALIKKTIVNDEIVEEQEKRTVYNTFEQFIDCEFIPKTGSINVVIENDGTDEMIVSDLMLSIGTIQVWSQHKDEMYGKDFLFDPTGLLIYNSTSSTPDIEHKQHSKTSNLSFETIDYDNNNNAIITSKVSKEEVITDTIHIVDGIYLGAYSSPAMKTIRYDDNNIIEY